MKFNTTPYFDDFDATKNFYKVLFKPGYAVQARELTTLQSMLQSQIEQIGDHFFKEGSLIIPGNINYIDNYYGPFDKDEIPAFVEEFAKKYNKIVEFEKNRIVIKTKNPYYDKNAKIEQKNCSTT